MLKHEWKFTANLRKKPTCFQRSHNEFEAECVMCSPWAFVSVANKGSLDTEAHLGTTKHKDI
jgi:hypothetical protein